jgi:hypothetical protein
MPSPLAPATPPACNGTTSASDGWRALASRFLEGYFQRSPVSTSWAGDHRYDGNWPDLSAAGDAGLRELLMETRSDLAKVPRNELELQERIDAQTLDDTLSYELFSLDVLRPHERDPLFYTDMIGEALDRLVNRNFGTVESRLVSLLRRLDGIPVLVAVAKQRLERPARINTETAIKQNLGLLDLVEHQLAPRFPAGGPALQASAERAVVALRELQKFFEQDLLARSDAPFRLGRSTFEKKLRLVLQDDVEIDSLAESARELLRQTQLEMWIRPPEFGSKTSSVGFRRSIARRSRRTSSSACSSTSPRSALPTRRSWLTHGNG